MQRGLLALVLSVLAACGAADPPPECSDLAVREYSILSAGWLGCDPESIEIDRCRRNLDAEAWRASCAASVVWCSRDPEESPTLTCMPERADAGA